MVFILFYAILKALNPGCGKCFALSSGRLNRIFNGVWDKVISYVGKIIGLAHTLLITI